MRAYVCDKCGRKIIRKAAIKDKHCTVIFPMSYAAEEGGQRGQNMWGSFSIELNGNAWSDLCTVCIEELIVENLNRK